MALNFQEAWWSACRRARCDKAQTATATLAQDVMNDYYEELCNLCPEAPWMRKPYRFVTWPDIEGVTATWTQDNNALVIGAAEALTAAQQAAYVEARIRNPIDSSWYWVSSIPGATSITLDKNYLGTTTVANGAWHMFLDLYDVPADYSGVIDIEAPIGPPKLAFAGEIELRELVYMGVEVGTPTRYSIVYDGAGTAHLLLVPSPDEAQLYTLNYTVAITRLTGVQSFILPAEAIQSIIYRTAGDLAVMVREDADLGGYLNGLGVNKWDKLVNKFAPQRPGPRFRLPRSLRPWHPRTLYGSSGGYTSDVDVWARGGR